MKKQILKGMFWVFIDTFLLKGISFIGGIILARILTPNDFGLIAMISIFIAIGVTIVDSGLSSSLIRNIRNSESDYSTVLFTNVFISLILYVFFYLTAPFIANFFNQEILTLIIRVYCISFFISALNSVQTAKLIRELEFKKITYLNLPGVILGTSLGIYMAYIGFGVWSIIAMYLCTQFFQMIFFWFGSSWKPRFIFSLEKLRYHYNYGYKLFFAGFLNNIFANFYYVVIGKFFPLNKLGYFERANMFNQYPVIILTAIIGKVSFPLLSTIQEDKNLVKSVFKKLVNLTFFITAPIMLGLSALAEPLVLLVLGEKWLPSVPIFQILCFGGTFYTLQALNNNILKIYGETGLILKGEILLKVIVVITVFIAYFFGFYAIILTIAINSFITLIVNIHNSNKIMAYPVKEQLLGIFPIFMAALTMFFLMLGLQFFLLREMSLLIQLAAISLGGFISYSSICYFLKIPALFYFLDLLKNLKQKKQFKF